MLTVSSLRFRQMDGGRLRTHLMSDMKVKGRPGPGSHQVTKSVEVETSTGFPWVAAMSGE